MLSQARRSLALPQPALRSELAQCPSSGPSAVRAALGASFRRVDKCYGVSAKLQFYVSHAGGGERETLSLPRVSFYRLPIVGVSTPRSENVVRKAFPLGLTASGLKSDNLLSSIFPPHEFASTGFGLGSVGSQLVRTTWSHPEWNFQNSIASFSCAKLSGAEEPVECCGMNDPSRIESPSRF